MIRAHEHVLGTALFAWYAAHGRHDLPWRTTRDPYRILVSEFMLQQTQVARVTAKFEAFTAVFPDFAALAGASTAQVLREWKGLGYNSRAVRLQRIATIVCEDFAGSLPREKPALLRLPGIGAYTAAALRVFAFEEDDIAFDTNIRRVVHRFCYGVEFPRAVPAPELEKYAREVLPDGRAHDWNSALMDLGAAVCTSRSPKCWLCPLQEHCAAAPLEASSLDKLRRESAKRRSPQESLSFEMTTRYARGRIVDRLRELPPGGRISLLDLQHDLRTVLPPGTLAGIEKTLGALERDGIVSSHGESFALPE
ncbi:MAG: A/G-specific adenine glycosylase [Vulcanimicrobiaceae bacterium]